MATEQAELLKMLAEARRKRIEIEQAAQQQPAQEQPLDLPAAIPDASKARVMSGLRQTGAGLLGTMLDMADPGAGLGTTMQNRFARDESARMEGVPENQVAEFVGQVLPAVAVGPVSATTVGGRMALSAATGAVAGAAASPGERTKGAAAGAAVSGLVQGGLETASAATRWLVGRVQPMVEASKSIGDEAIALVDEYMPKGSQGFAGDLRQSIGLRMQKLAQRRDAIWDAGIAAAKQASGGRTLLATAPKLRDAIEVGLQDGSLPPGVGKWLTDNLDNGMDIEAVNSAMTRINRLSKSPNLEKAAVASELRRAMLDDLGAYSGPGVSEIMAMRKAYAPVAQTIEQVRHKVLKRIFGVSNVKAAGDIPDEIVIKKFANLKPSEQGKVMDLLRTNAPAIASQARGVILQSALDDAGGQVIAGRKLVDPEKLIANVSGRGRAIKLSAMMSPDESQGMLNLLSRWQASINTAKGVGELARPPWGVGEATNFLADGSARVLAYLRTGKSVQTLAFTPEGQRALAALSVKNGVVQDAVAANIWFEIMQDEGLIKEKKQ